MHDLAADDAFDSSVRLLQPRKAPPALAQFIGDIMRLPHAELATEVANQARVSSHTLCSWGDVVLVRSETAPSFQAGQIQLLAACVGEPFAVVHLWSCTKLDRASGCAEWRRDGQSEVVPFEDILAAVVHTGAAAVSTRTLLPVHLRSSQS